MSDAMSGVQDLENNNSTTQLCLWNPMETDFLSRRNLYSVDDEDTNMVLQGYSKLIINFCQVCLIHL